MCRPLDPIPMGEIPDPSEYELIRMANIEEKRAEYLRIFGYPLPEEEN